MSPTRARLECPGSGPSAAWRDAAAGEHDDRTRAARAAAVGGRGAAVGVGEEHHQVGVSLAGAATVEVQLDPRVRGRAGRADPPAGVQGRQDAHRIPGTPRPEAPLLPWPLSRCWLEDQLVAGRGDRQAEAAGHRPGLVPPDAALAVQPLQDALDPFGVAGERLGQPCRADGSAAAEQQPKGGGEHGMLEGAAAAKVWDVWLTGHRSLLWWLRRPACRSATAWAATATTRTATPARTGLRSAPPSAPSSPAASGAGPAQQISTSSPPPR